MTKTATTQRSSTRTAEAGAISRRSDSRARATRKCFELGVSQASYKALRRVLQSRPFDAMPGLAYQYFFLPKYSRSDGTHAWCEIRIEQGRDARGFDFVMPKPLIANLLWFDRMRSFRPARRLRSWSPGETAIQRNLPDGRPWWRRLWLRLPWAA